MQQKSVFLLNICVREHRYITLRLTFILLVFLLPHGATAPNGPGTPLDRRRDFCQTTHNTHNRQTLMPLVGFEPTISAGERPQTYALDRAAIGTGTTTATTTTTTTNYYYYYYCYYSIRFFITNVLAQT